jgi:hypothetical protein
MKVTLTFTLALLACLAGGAPRNKPPTKLQPDAPPLQRSTCAEAPFSVTDASAKGSRGSINCNQSVALSRARTKAYDDAFNALEPDCSGQISADEAAALCRSLGRSFIVADADSTIIHTIPRPQGADNIDATWSIAGTSRCVTFRDIATKITRGANECLFFAQNFHVKFKVRARCGVKCISLD